MESVKAVVTALKRYATFRGRAGRAEFLWFLVFVTCACILASLTSELASQAFPAPAGAKKPALPLLVAFGVLVLPFLSCGWRRMQDGGLSGYWIAPFLPVWLLFFFLTIHGFVRPDYPPGLVGIFVPIVAMLVFFLGVLLAIPLTKPSDPGSNRYGPNPHEVMS